jgi:uncharacterized protein YprB with RNaseH-like and TPR domain
VATLADRLRRLKRDPADDVLRAGGPQPPTPELSELERTLALDRDDALSLKQRLERLVAVAARRAGERPPAWTMAPVPLEELIAGRRATNDRGEYFLVEHALHLESLQGDVPLTRFRALHPDTVSVLSGDPGLGGFDLGDAVFLDTETTGLAGGTGTAAFLVGVGYVDGDRFRVKQYFMRDYHEEAALLRGVAEDVWRFRHVVTFNGRTFDVPLLESRYRLNRERFPLGGARHLDLLHPARRLWKARLESCRLQVLERALLGVRRVGDVDGDEIPRIYFDFVRRRDGRAMARVLEHNRTDVVSLAALAALACQWVEGAHAQDPRDLYSLGQVYERAAHFERSEEQYRRALECGDHPVRVPALLRLADRAKKRGDLALAVPLWEEAAEAGHWWALRELARHHEHRTRDLGRALGCVERALCRLRGTPDAAPHRMSDLMRRRERIVGKLEAAGSPA